MNILCLSAGLAAACLAADQSLTTNAPTDIIEWHGSQLKGAPTQLAWSPDNTTLYLQTLEGDSPGKPHAYSVTLATRTFRALDAAPDWVGKYWEWKSSRTPPGRPDLVIQVVSTTKAGKVPMQSLREKAKDGLMENAIAAQGETGSLIRTLMLKDEPIGQYVDQPLVPGMTFGWSPEALHAVAYARPDGRLAVLDFNGGRIDVSGTKGVLLPAWSPDGSKVAYLQKTGRRDYTLATIDVARP